MTRGGRPPCLVIVRKEETVVRRLGRYSSSEKIINPATQQCTKSPNTYKNPVRLDDRTTAVETGLRYRFILPAGL